MSELLQLITNGVMSGAILAMGAVGVTLVLGVLRLLHVAHGDTLAFGTYAGLFFASTFGGNIVIGTIGAVVATAVLAAVGDVVLWRPLRRRQAGMVSLLLASIGAALVLRHVIFYVAGGGTRRFELDLFRVYTIGTIRLSQSQLAALIIAIASVAAVAWLFSRTTIGKTMRALADDADLAAVAGIDVDRTIIVIWLLSGALAGLAGVLQGLVQDAFTPNLGFQLLLPIFAAVILGGIGSAYGALVGGLILGLSMEVSTWSALAGGVPPAYKLAVAFVVLILMLIMRPQGIFGTVRLR